MLLLNTLRWLPQFSDVRFADHSRPTPQARTQKGLGFRLARIVRGFRVAGFRLQGFLGGTRWLKSLSVNPKPYSKP